MIAEGRHPERASVAGRNAVRNYWIAFADLARRWVRAHTAGPRKIGAAAGRLTVRVTGAAAAGQVLGASKTAAAVFAAGGLMVDTVAGAGGSLAMLAADFMVRHAAELRDLARSGGPSFGFLATFLDWLLPSAEQIKRDADEPGRKP